MVDVSALNILVHKCGTKFFGYIFKLVLFLACAAYGNFTDCIPRRSDFNSSFHIICSTVSLEIPRRTRFN